MDAVFWQLARGQLIVYGAAVRLYRADGVRSGGTLRRLGPLRPVVAGPVMAEPVMWSLCGGALWWSLGGRAVVAESLWWVFVWGAYGGVSRGLESKRAEELEG
jgi:hypothetical protein